MKYFLDTEFSENGPHHPIQLISIGIVREDGRQFYAESSDFDPDDCNAWVKKHVFPHLTGKRLPLRVIAADIKLFIGDDKPEFWGYFADDKNPVWGWNRLSRETRAKWQLVGLALAEKLCPHDDVIVTSSGNIWCNKCGWQIPKEKL